MAISFLPPIKEANFSSLLVATGNIRPSHHDDLAMVSENSGNVFVLINNELRSGSFAASPSTLTVPSPGDIVVGDFNDDLNPDVLVTSFAQNSLYVVLGNGNDSFQPNPASFATGLGPNRIATGDFNEDGELDAIVHNVSDANGGDISILLGNGDGTFQPATSAAVGSYPDGITVADVNHDNHLDVLVANNNDASVSVLLGNGDGSFQSQLVISGGSGQFDDNVAVADFNNDGILDVAIGDYNNDYVRVLFGKGDGTFHGEVHAVITGGAVNGTSWWVASDDFNSDGISDLVVATSTSTAELVLSGGDGSFCQAIDVSFADPVYQIIIDDLDGDGLPDLIGYGGVSVDVAYNASTLN